MIHCQNFQVNFTPSFWSTVNILTSIYDWFSVVFICDLHWKNDFVSHNNGTKRKHLRILNDEILSLKMEDKNWLIFYLYFWRIQFSVESMMTVNSLPDIYHQIRHCTHLLGVDENLCLSSVAQVYKNHHCTKTEDHNL